MLIHIGTISRRYLSTGDDFVSTRSQSKGAENAEVIVIRAGDFSVGSRRSNAGRRPLDHVQQQFVGKLGRRKLEQSVGQHSDRRILEQWWQLLRFATIKWGEAGLSDKGMDAVESARCRNDDRLVQLVLRRRIVTGIGLSERFRV